MDVELLIVSAVGFFGLIFIVIIALWDVSNRIGDKIGNLGMVLDTKFDIIIDKLSSITTDLSVVKELSRSPQTVSFQLEHSGVKGTISTRPDEFTSELLSYFIKFSVPINKEMIQNAIRTLASSKFQFLGSSDKLILFMIRSRDVDENASLIKAFIQELDKELSVDNSKEIIESIENELKKIL